MSYNVYLVSNIGAPRDHHCIFVETNDDESGYIIQVTGNIQNGMTFGFVGKEHIGTVSKDKYNEIQRVAETIETPKKQFDGPKRINPKEPLRRCQEWASEAVQALKDAGVLEE
jgi:hypothetical protein